LAEDLKNILEFLHKILDEAEKNGMTVSLFLISDRLRYSDQKAAKAKAKSYVQKNDW